MATDDPAVASLPDDVVARLRALTDDELGVFVRQPIPALDGRTVVDVYGSPDGDGVVRRYLDDAEALLRGATPGLMQSFDGPAMDAGESVDHVFWARYQVNRQPSRFSFKPGAVVVTSARLGLVASLTSRRGTRHSNWWRWQEIAGVVADGRRPRLQVQVGGAQSAWIELPDVETRDACAAAISAMRA